MSDRKEELDFLQDFTMAPDWTRGSADKQKYEHFADEHERDATRDRHGGRRGGRGERRDDRRRDRGRDSGRFERRPPADFDSGRQRPPADRGERHFGERVARPDGGGHPASSERRFSERRGPREREEGFAESPLNVRFLPEQKALSVVMHKVSRGHRAFPIRDLARLFLDNPNSCEVRIEVRSGVDAEVKFHQCASCGFAALREEELREHVKLAHFEDFFDSETTVGDAPSGSFVCVAKCGFTGKLLGPPNHHSYNQNIQDMLRGECRHVSEDEYRSRIETLRDEESIARWREEARTVTLYRRKREAAEDEPRGRGKGGKAKAAEAEKAAETEKPAEAAEVAVDPADVASELESAEQPAATEGGDAGVSAVAEVAAEGAEAVVAGSADTAESSEAAGDAQAEEAPRSEEGADDDASGEAPGEAVEEAIDRATADGLFVREILPGLLKTPKTVVCTFDTAMKLRDPMLSSAVRDSWRREQRFTASLFFALRGALRHKRMYIFRTGEGRGIDFVMGTAPTVLDVTHAVPELKAIFDYLVLHPGATRNELLDDLSKREGEGLDMEVARNQLAWITERAHVIEFHNGVLALPEERPVYRHLREERGDS